MRLPCRPAGARLVLCGLLPVMLAPAAARGVDVTLEPDRTYQVMDGIGACACAFPYAGADGWNWDAVRSVFDELDLRYIRMYSFLWTWEPFNDNLDPFTIDWNGFGGGSSVIPLHDVPFARYLASRGIEVSVGVWRFADWLASGSPRRIDPSLYPEVGEAISAYILNMQNQGVPQHYVEVQNEPAIEASIQYPDPHALRDAGLQVVEQLDRHGLGHIQLHAPNSHMPPDTVTWGEVWMQEPALRARTAAVSYHTWWSVSFSDYDVIRQFAEKYDKPVWATEVGYCALPSGCYGGTSFLLPQTWGTAWDYAWSHYRAIAWSHATRTYQWTILGWDAAVGKSGQRYPSFYALKHFANYIPPGAVRIGTVATDAALSCLAFRLPDGDYTLIVLNRAALDKPVTVSLTTKENLIPQDGYSTRETRYWFQAPDLARSSNGTLSFTAPGESITSVRIQPRLAPGDFDRDVDVDMVDLQHLRGCRTGDHAGPPSPACADADLDGDGDVDQADFGILQRCLSGTGKRADPFCSGG